jgi:hypothetical protein
MGRPTRCAQIIALEFIDENGGAGYTTAEEECGLSLTSLPKTRSAYGGFRQNEPNFPNDFWLRL